MFLGSSCAPGARTGLATALELIPAGRRYVPVVPRYLARQALRAMSGESTLAQASVEALRPFSEWSVCVGMRTYSARSSERLGSSTGGGEGWLEVAGSGFATRFPSPPPHALAGAYGDVWATFGPRGESFCASRGAARWSASLLRRYVRPGRRRFRPPPRPSQRSRSPRVQ
jgi:hypothetical protein